MVVLVNGSAGQIVLLVAEVEKSTDLGFVILRVRYMGVKTVVEIFQKKHFAKPSHVQLMAILMNGKTGLLVLIAVEVAYKQELGFVLIQSMGVVHVPGISKNR
jgi:hypothetical protein